MKSYYVYVLSNKKRHPYYVGVTNDLVRRLEEHRRGLSAYTKQYNLHRLLYFEETSSAEDAIAREKQLKNWRRSWKEGLISSLNPNFRDLYKDGQFILEGDPEINSG